MSTEQKGSVLLTGAAGGMGTAIAKAMVDAGHRVVLLDRDEGRLMSLAQSLAPKRPLLSQT